MRMQCTRPTLILATKKAANCAVKCFATHLRPQHPGRSPYATAKIACLTAEPNGIGVPPTAAHSTSQPFSSMPRARCRRFETEHGILSKVCPAVFWHLASWDPQMRRSLTATVCACLSATAVCPSKLLALPNSRKQAMHIRTDAQIRQGACGSQASSVHNGAIDFPHSVHGDYSRTN